MWSGYNHEVVWHKLKQVELSDRAELLTADEQDLLGYTWESHNEDMSWERMDSPSISPLKNVDQLQRLKLG